jgi:hypothetical protein
VAAADCDAGLAEEGGASLVGTCPMRSAARCAPGDDSGTGDGDSGAAGMPLETAPWAVAGAVDVAGVDACGTASLLALVAAPVSGAGSAVETVEGASALTESFGAVFPPEAIPAR